MVKVCPQGALNLFGIAFTLCLIVLELPHSAYQVNFSTRNSADFLKAFI